MNKDRNLTSVLILFLLFITIHNAFAQASVTINDYGVYFIDEGKVRKLPIEAHVSYPRLWRNYIAFAGMDSNFMIIYNIENGAVSDLLLPGQDSGRFALKNSKKNLLFYNYGMKYELNPVTLKTVASRTVILNIHGAYPGVDASPEIESDWGDTWHSTRTKYISEYTRRFQGVNYYLDVTFSQNIDPLKIQEDMGGKTNQFVLIIDKRYDGR